MKRRNFIRSLVGGAVLPAVGCSSPRLTPGNVRFEHGVASGDPMSDRVILWTRISGLDNEYADVAWRASTDPDLQNVISEGTFRTGPHRDYTVKVDAGGLPPGARIYYRFAVGDRMSPVGRTRTLPEPGVDSAAFAVVSCSNHPYGYFHVYREIAARDDLDAVIHLGDYIYEYGLGEYATERAEQLGRLPEPRHRLLSLGDYRRRHAQYKADPDSRAMHAAHPLIAVWDDHEIANDAWRGGAENHRNGDGSWEARRDAAIQAWLEWMPVRLQHDAGATRIFRHYRFGDLLSLIMLDTRLTGRDRQPDAGPDRTREAVGKAILDPDRRLLGAAQEDWMRRALRESAGTVWQVIGQQVMVYPTLSPELGPLLDLERESMLPPEQLAGYIAASEGNPPMLLDTWNGYPAAREDFLGVLEAHADNPVVLSGDLHTSLAGNLVPAGGKRPVAVEFMTTSVTSPGFAEYLPETRPGVIRDATLAVNPGLRYMETSRRGWLLLTLSAQTCSGEWYLVDTVQRRDYSVSLDARWIVRAGDVRAGLLPG